MRILGYQLDYARDKLLPFRCQGWHGLGGHAHPTFDRGCSRVWCKSGEFLRRQRVGGRSVIFRAWLAALQNTENEAIWLIPSGIQKLKSLQFSASGPQTRSCAPGLHWGSTSDSRYRLAFRSRHVYPPHFFDVATPQFEAIFIDHSYFLSILRVKGVRGCEGKEKKKTDNELYYSPLVLLILANGARTIK